MYTDYETACEAEVTRAEARREIIVVHHHDETTWKDFQGEYGIKEHYNGKAVLDFLGY